MQTLSSSSFFLHAGFVARMRPRAADGVVGRDEGGGGSKKSLGLGVRGLPAPEKMRSLASIRGMARVALDR
jgi:hypothetical protein